MSRPSRYRNHRSPWTLRELNFVKKHYDSMPTAEEERILAAEYLALGVAVAGQLPGRTQDAVKL